MAWSTSEIFRAFLHTALDNAQPFDLGQDSLKVALFNNAITPDQDAAAVSTAFNAGVWAAANEVSHAGQWATGGVVLASQVLSGGVPAAVFLDAADTVSGSAATLANVYGCLVYDDTLVASPGPADQGVCFNYFGGVQSVTAGTFTVQWHADGILRFTL